MSHDPFTEIAELLAAEEHATEETTRQHIADIITQAVRDTQGTLKPSTLFDGLSGESARLYAQELSSLIDRRILSTYFDLDGDRVETFIGFDVGA